MTHSALKHPIIFAIVLLILGGCAQITPFEHQVEVQAADTGQAIANASVQAEMGTRDFAESKTDADGLATLIIKSDYQDDWAKVIIEAEGYQKQSLLVELTEKKSPLVVQLQRPEAETSAEEQPAPTEEPVAPTEEPAPTEAAPEPTAAQAEHPTEASQVATGELANVPAVERLNYYQAKPELTIDPNKIYRATIKTSKGDIVVSLDATAAPEHVNNFIFLGKQGFYDGLTFHRVEPNFVIQGGDPAGSGEGGPGYTVPGEFDLIHGEGALAMARLSDQVNPDRESSGSQFYITLTPTPFLDGQYSVFGQVEEGMDVVQAIQVGDLIEQVIVEE